MVNEDKKISLPENYAINLSDFALFLSVMKNKRAYENTLSIIMNEPDLALKEVKVEQVIRTGFGDVYLYGTV